MGKNRKKKRTHKLPDHGALDKTPKSFVLKRGTIGTTVAQLMHDFRLVMEPNTATRLQVRKQNVLKDFVSVAGPMGVTHFIIFSCTDLATYMRIARLPRGPTLTFQVQEFSLARDVHSMQKRPKSHSGMEFRHAALLVLNNFARDGLHFKLMTTVLQNMFPSINVQTVKLDDIRRCVLFNYDAENNRIEFRHFDISCQPVGMSKGVKKLLHSKIPDLSKLTDISDFLLKSAQLSDSEADEPEESHVTLAQDVHGRGNAASKQSAIKLTELGPRMLLKLVKIEDGMCDGEVLHHALFKKTPEEIQQIKKRRDAARKLKEERKRIQQANVLKKKAAEEEHKRKCAPSKGSKSGGDDDMNDDDSGAEEPELLDQDEFAGADDDREWFRKEVGEEPESDMFQAPDKKRKREDDETRSGRGKVLKPSPKQSGGKFRSKPHQGKK